MPGFEVDGLPQHAHHLEAGVVAERQDARRRGAARPACASACRRCVRSSARSNAMPSWISQRIDIRAVEHHLRDEMPVGRISGRPERVLEVSLGAVVRADRGLDAAFGHDGVAVAQAQLGREDDLRAGRLPRPAPRRSLRRRRRRPARRWWRAAPRRCRLVDQRIALQDARDVGLTGIAAICPDLQAGPGRCRRDPGGTPSASCIDRARRRRQRRHPRPAR